MKRWRLKAPPLDLINGKKAIISCTKRGTFAWVILIVLYRRQDLFHRDHVFFCSNNSSVNLHLLTYIVDIQTIIIHMTIPLGERIDLALHMEPYQK